MPEDTNNNSQNEQEEELIFEEDMIGETDMIKKLKTHLKVCRQEKQDYLNGWQRSQADCINIKKRFDEDKQAFSSYATVAFIEDLLPVLDSFDMAFKDTTSWESVPENWRKGVEYIHTQFYSVLENYNVKELSPIGQQFDPNKHNSIEILDTNKEEEHNVVLSVLQKGYEHNGKIIRPPNVKVGNYTE